MSQILCISSGQVDSEQIQEAQRKFQVLTMQTLCKSLDEYLKMKLLTSQESNSYKDWRVVSKS